VRDSCNGVPKTGFLSPWDSVKETWRGSCSRVSDGYERMDRASVWAISTPSTGDFRMSTKGSLVVEGPSHGSSEEGSWVGLPCWGPLKDM
jgi:hypothetical protein